MKKIVVTLLIFTGIAVVWWKAPHTAAPAVQTSEVNAPTKTPEEILANDYEKIARNLRPENISGDEWKDINNYSLTPEMLVNKDSAQKYFATANSNLPDIYSCLKKDFCGMEVRNEDDAYFDDQRTPAHILINRNLIIMKESLRKDSALASQVNWELMQELASSGDELLSVESLDIIREFDSKSVKTDELIKMTSDFKGTAKAEALERISKNKDQNGKLILASEIEEVFAMSDNNTIISVLEKLGAMGFSSVQVSKILRNLCDKKEDHNWGMIKTIARKLDSNFEKNCN